VLGLPDGGHVCLFDLDGVLTKTAKVHAAAWEEMFDAYLRERAARTGEEFVPFDPVADYDEYVDGKPRYDGVQSFLHARGIELARRAQRSARCRDDLGGPRSSVHLL
jgi:beta-phosphoglucomutase-like phosphatase (HAD superfamily)